MRHGRDLGSIVIDVWILIIVLVTPTGAAMTTSEYGDHAACVAAGENFQAANVNDGWRVSWS